MSAREDQCEHQNSVMTKENCKSMRKYKQQCVESNMKETEIEIKLSREQQAYEQQREPIAISVTEAYEEPRGL
eukprot:6813832-Ditylum_brightwellii.AAC.1